VPNFMKKKKNNNEKLCSSVFVWRYGSLGFVPRARSHVNLIGYF
jgi:hypothetical protein